MIADGVFWAGDEDTGNLAAVPDSAPSGPAPGRLHPALHRRVDWVPRLQPSALLVLRARCKAVSLDPKNCEKYVRRHAEGRVRS